MRANKRLMVETLRPTILAMVRMGMRLRRSCSMRRRRAESQFVRVVRGHELRSCKPAKPCSVKRLSHLRAVRSLMPAAWAAGISPMVAMHSMSNWRPAKVSLAFLWVFIRRDSSGMAEAW